MPKIELDMRNTSTTKIHQINVPYSLKQLTQECEAGINLRFITEDEPEITPVNR